MCLAIPGKILEVEGNKAVADFKGLEKEVRIDPLSEDVGEGDYILSHAGFAIASISPEEAKETLDKFDEILGEGREDREVSV
ncbi:hypothetical protein AKJ51_03605 [candidate division MSBL1 archaeon SCGC-AAA382A20]|uniref:Hydrogenase assembly protein HypC n=1 Tax=candidate division MSBL1 archaeon SCGC-AAA382A20 TaxID=1698280 RepID=A0A133VJC0_9EURY|nr:hypothetical protein AKJ51_03605 [candidate division MSBL1 archaeon SCGC-AAA382A20]